MPASLPVPSKGALRTLRHLALGTSCTVALGAGLLTEDRRRRIHAARTVRDNGKKLKSAKQYHTGGAAVKGFLDDPNSGEWDIDLHTIRKQPRKPVPPEKPRPTLPGHVEAKNLAKSTFVEKPLFKSIRTPDPLYSDIPTTRLFPLAENRPTKRVSVGYDRQHRLACDVQKLLETQDGLAPSLENVNAAAGRFIEAFEEGMGLGAIDPKLMDVSIQLSAACRAEKKLDEAEKIFDIILSFGPIDEEKFFEFRPWDIIIHMINGPYNPATGQRDVNAAKLQKACSIYITQLNAEPVISFKRGMLKVGRKLCAETCKKRMFDITLAVYNRMEKSRGDLPNPAESSYITALHGLRKHYSVVQAFLNGPYTQSSPTQTDYYHISTTVMNSLKGVQYYEKQEEVMFMLIELGERLKLKVSTSAILKTLGNDWNVHKDISRTTQLFDRLVPKLHLASHPGSAYAFIIQCCVEADDETLALVYEERSRSSRSGRNPTDLLDVTRIQGSFALAKAMRNDWRGVRSDFQTIVKLNQIPDIKVLDTIFDKIFAIFAKSHSITETEDFLREYVEEFSLSLTTTHSNIIIEQYLKNKEIDSVFRWLDFMSSVGTSVDSVFFNQILLRCHKEWRFSHDQIFGLYFAMAQGKYFDEQTIDNATLSLLRHIATSNAGHNNDLAVKRLNHLDRIVKMPSNYQKSPTECMAEALCRGNPTEALDIYTNALSAELPLHRYALATAIRASLLVNPYDASHAVSLLRSRRKDQDFSAAFQVLFVHQISTDNSPERMHEITLAAFSTLEQNGIPALQDLAYLNYPMSIMVYRHRFRDALDFWNAMVYREGEPPVTPRLKDLTVHLQAFLGLRKPKGLDWVLRMAHANKIPLDYRFRMILKRARREEEAFLLEKYGCIPQNSASEWLECITRTLEIVKSMRVEGVADKKATYQKMIALVRKGMTLQNNVDLSKKGPGSKWRARHPKIRQDYEEIESPDLPMESWMGLDEAMDYSQLPADINFWVDRGTTYVLNEADKV